jgi:hypothetical protein
MNELKELTRLFIALVFFYLAYRLLIGITALSDIPLFIIIIIFAIYMFLPDISNPNNFFNINKNIFAIGILIISLMFLFFTKLSLVSFIILILLGLFTIFTKNQEFAKSVYGGLIMSIPLYFINPLFFIFGFLGFFSFWISNKL